MMYLKNDIPRYRASYLGFVRELRENSPGSRDLIDAATAIEWGLFNDAVPADQLDST